MLKAEQPTILLFLVTDGAENEKEDHEIVLKPIQIILDEYKDVFKESKEFPSRQTYDHKIDLVSDTSMVSIRLYRYVHA